MKLSYTIFIVLFMLCIPELKAVTYYSAGNGLWDDNNSWSLTEGGPGGAGVPSNTDDVIILTGHTIEIIAFATTHFVHSGNITVRAGATLYMSNAGDGFFDFAGADKAFNIYGTFRTENSNSRLRNRGFLHMHPGSVVEIANDFQIFDISNTIVDINMMVADDLRVVGPGGQVCGNGSITLGIDPAARVTNALGGTGLNQVCPGVCIINDGPPGITNCGIGSFSLPVSLIAFEIQDNILFWEVIESQVSAFEVYHSEDLNTWELKTILDSQGDGQQTYRLSLETSGYYRIQSVESNPFISSILFYEGEEVSDIQVFPNPVKPNQSIYFKGADLQSVEIYDTQGKFIRKLPLSEDALVMDLPLGQYLLRINTSRGNTQRRMIIE